MDKWSVALLQVDDQGAKPVHLHATLQEVQSLQVKGLFAQLTSQLPEEFLHLYTSRSRAQQGFLLPSELEG